MSQVLHLFKKDLRHLWPQIAIVWSLAALFSWTEASRANMMLLMPRSGVLTTLLPLAMWYLVSAAVHSESLVDDRQYWVTRPIVWHRLLAAKGLFVVAVFHLPMVAADCFVLATQGFSPIEYLPSLVWRQALLFVAWMLPAAVFSAVTKNLAQLALIGFALVALLIATEPLFQGRDQYWGAFHWVKSSAISLVVVAAAAFILATQYALRRTWLSRSVAAAALLLSGLFYMLAPWEWAFAVQSSLSRQHAGDDVLQVSFVPDAPVPPPPAMLTVRPTKVISIPLRISGIPEDHEVVVNRISISIQTGEGRSDEVHGWLPRMTYDRDRIYWHAFSAGDSWLEVAPREPVSAMVSLFLTLYCNPQETSSAATDDPSAMPDGSLCTPDAEAVPGFLFLSCRSPLRGPTRTKARLHHRPTGESRTTELTGWPSYSPFPTGISLSPISRKIVRILLDEEVFPRRDPRASPWKVTPEECDLEYQTWQPLAHIRRSCEIPSIELGAYLR